MSMQKLGLLFLETSRTTRIVPIRHAKQDSTAVKVFISYQLSIAEHLAPMADQHRGGRSLPRTSATACLMSPING